MDVQTNEYKLHPTQEIGNISKRKQESGTQNYEECCSEIGRWTETDYAGCMEARKSTSGGVLKLVNH